MKYKDKVQKIHRYHKIVWEDTYSIFGFRRYHYEKEWSVAYYGPVFRYRYDPVPGVKHWKNSIVGCYRHPRTTQELRWYFAHKEFVRIRGKRSPKYLPTWYDDIPLGKREKGWKRTKKRKQWMKGVNREKQTDWRLFLVD